MKRASINKIIFLSFCLFYFPACDELLSEAMEESFDRLQYGYYELDIPDTGDNRIAGHTARIELDEAVSWVEINYEIENPGPTPAKMNVYVKPVFEYNPKREYVKTKWIDAHSTVEGTIDEGDSESLASFVDMADWCSVDVVCSLPLRVIFKAETGPPNMVARFRIVIEKL